MCFVIFNFYERKDLRDKHTLLKIWHISKTQNLEQLHSLAESKQSFLKALLEKKGEKSFLFRIVPNCLCFEILQGKFYARALLPYLPKSMKNYKQI